MLKLVTDSRTCLYLTDILNNVVKDCAYSSELKFGDVTPVHKAEERTSKLNYRPISILPVLTKVLEKLLVKRIDNFMKNKLSPLLCGFRAKYNTQHALFRLLLKWQQSLDEGKEVGVCNFADDKTLHRQISKVRS